MNIKYALILSAFVFSSFILQSGIIDVMPSARLNDNTKMSFCIVAYIEVNVSISETMDSKVFAPNQCECFEVPIGIYTIEAKSTTNSRLLKRVIIRP